jgi:hypothetical protein
MRTLDLYFIATRPGRYVLFGAVDIVEQCELESGDRIRRFINWVMTRHNRIVAWVGRVLKAGHDYYVRLEDRIDPVERVLKAVACSAALNLYYAPSADEAEIRARFSAMLRKQRIKHTFWLCVDSLIGSVVIVFTPILAPIPGPNVFFYYPALRVLSHYRALKGARQGLSAIPVEFMRMPELAELESNLRASEIDNSAVRAFAEKLQIPGLARFLERLI